MDAPYRLFAILYCVNNCQGQDDPVRKRTRNGYAPHRERHCPRILSTRAEILILAQYPERKRVTREANTLWADVHFQNSKEMGECAKADLSRNGPRPTIFSIFVRANRCWVKPTAPPGHFRDIKQKG